MRLSVLFDLVRLAAVFLLLGAASVNGADQTVPGDVRQAQLFLDDGIIESSTLLQRMIHKPVRHSTNPILSPEEPWEGETFDRLHGVFRDEKTGIFRAYYSGKPRIGGDNTAGWVPGMPKLAFTICIATSTNGVHWTRPKLDNYKDLVGGPSNIVLNFPDLRVTSPTILHDPDDLEHPWKMIFQSANRLPARYRVRIATSKDGLKWTLDTGPDEGLDAEFHDRLTAMLDRGNGAGPYVLFSRPGGRVVRSLLLDYHEKSIVREVFQARLSADGKELASRPTLALKSDLEEDDPLIEPYHMNAFRYESIYIAYILNYFSGEPPSARVDLAVSRDAERWQRVRPRSPFIPALSPEERESGRWDAGGVQPTVSAPILYNGALWIYYVGSPAFHGSMFLKGEQRMGLAKLRPDGFTSLRANWRAGLVTTKPFVWPGGHLEVNSRIQGGNGTPDDGWVRVAILDETGQPMPGYSRAESDPLVTDSIHPAAPRGLTWSRKPQNLDPLIGKKIRLRFFLRQADLYSFRAVMPPKVSATPLGRNGSGLMNRPMNQAANTAAGKLRSPAPANSAAHRLIAEVSRSASSGRVLPVGLKADSPPFGSAQQARKEKIH